MVFKKPFAFIIRHFKAFHLVMLVTSVYIMFNASQIRSLIVSLVSANALMYGGAKNYASSPVIAIALIGLIAVGFVYWLFKSRKKDLKYYTYVIIYYLFSIVGFIYLFSKLKTLATQELNIDSLNLIRDTSLLIMIASLPVVVISFLRGLGFNIKQFNFSKDVEELSITDKDSEEFEILIGQNNYKYMRKIRKITREIKYLILENLFYITVVAGVLLAFGAISLATVIYKNNHQVQESHVTVVNGVSYVVNGTYITSRSMRGEELKPGYKYVIVNVSMQNQNENVTKKYNQDIISLQTGRLIYNPISYFQNEFLEIGKYLKKDEIIPTNSFLTGNIVFEIPASMNVTRFSLRIMKGIVIEDNDFFVDYVRFAANGVNLDREKQTINLNLNQRINTTIIDSGLFNIVVKDYKLQDSFEDKYVVCSNELNCNATSTIVRPTALGNNTMLILYYEGALSSEATYYEELDTMEKFTDVFTHVEYTIGQKNYSIQSKVLKNDINGKLFIEVDRAIVKASDIKVVFDFRNETYVINVK